MDKNKSIDGLVSRSKKVAASMKAPQPAPKKVHKSAPPSAPHQTTPTATATTTATTTSANPTTSPPSPHTDPTADFLTPVHAFDLDGQNGELTVSKHKSTPQTDNHPKTKTSKKLKKSKKPFSKKKKIILSIVITFFTLLLITGVSLVLWGNDIIAKITGGQGNIFDLLTFTDDHYDPLKTDSNGRTNLLVFGTSGYNMDGEYGDGVHDGAQLTDSIMVISLDQDTGDLAMLSLPRDLKASPTCTATGKINEVYWCNNQNGDTEQSGALALMTEVGNILDIDFQYYAHLNWGSLVQIVDTLDGITVNLDEDIQDYAYTGAVFEAGVDYTINGEQALGLARARHGTASGDFSRGASQQKILIGIKDRIFEKHLSITDLISLANTLGDNLRTNFSVEEIKTVAHLASDFDFNTMRQISLIDPEMLVTTGTINGISYVLPAEGIGIYTNIRNYATKMFSSDPKIYEDASILVLNGTLEAGLASTEQALLKDEGYNYVFVGDIPEGEYTEPYTLYIVNPDKTGTAKLLEEKYHITASSDLPDGISSEFDFVLILGSTPEDDEAE